MLNTNNQDLALCTMVSDPDTFFPHDTDFEKIAYAKSICAECPLAFDCLETAMADSDLRKWGIWGGTTPDERKKMLRNPSIRLRVFAEAKATSEKAVPSIREVGKAIPSYNKNSPFAQ